MPHFSPTGHDLVLCQKCGRDIDCGKDEPHWRPDITGNASAGNICPECLLKHELGVPNKEYNGPVSIYEHCKIESGLTNPADIMAYLNRYYGSN